MDQVYTVLIVISVTRIVPKQTKNKLKTLNFSPHVYMPTQHVYHSTKSQNNIYLPFYQNISVLRTIVKSYLGSQTVLFASLRQDGRSV
jgi:hypothetical protein